MREKHPCSWVRVDGHPCEMPALRESDSCGQHDPNGKYALQHPEHRKRLLDRIANKTNRRET